SISVVLIRVDVNLHLVAERNRHLQRIDLRGYSTGIADADGFGRPLIFIAGFHYYCVLIRSQGGKAKPPISIRYSGNFRGTQTLKLDHRPSGGLVAWRKEDTSCNLFIALSTRRICPTGSLRIRDAY